MDHDAQRLTVTLLLFEATDGRRTLTDALAKAFVSFFNSESAWHASINQDGGHEAALSEGDLVTGGHPYYVIELTHRTLEINGHNLEAAKEPVETLCREFWDPNGSLSPRRISPNPNLIFVVHANPNSPTDDMFLTSFVESFVRYGRTEEPLASTSKRGVVSRGLSVVKNLMKLAGGTISEQDKNAGAASVAEQTASAIDQARVLFAELDNIQLENNRHVVTAELHSARQHFEDLRRTVSAMATRRKDAEVQGKEASTAFYQLLLVAAAGLVLLHPAVGGALAAQLPGAVSGLDFAGNADTLNSALALGKKGYQQVLNLHSEAGTAKDVAKKLQKTQSIISRRLYVAVIAALRSDYRHHPNAAEFARLVMDMAAAVDLDALKGWSDRASLIRSADVTDWKLGECANDWER